MALAELLEDGVELLDHRHVDVATAREATYVFSNQVTYRYPAPIRSLRHRFVVVPRLRHGDQRRIVHRLHLDLPRHAALLRRSDRFGNPVVDVHADHVRHGFSFGVRAVLHRTRTGGDQPQDWRPEHTRAGRLTAPEPGLRNAAAVVSHRHRRERDSGIQLAVAIGEHVRSTMTYEPGTTGVRTTAADAWELGRGVCQDMAHVMIAMCRSQGVTARYVSGHLLGEGASHAWVEVRDPATGRTLAYDPTHARPTDLRYVTVAVGRDYADVAPTAGAYAAGPAGELSVRKRVAVTSIA
jgi:transglutaminase-like putative cysteine protease